MVDQSAGPERGSQTPRLAFLDGLRGLVALYLVFFHVLADGEPAMSADTRWLNALRLGDEAAVFFVVLSGYVNALPVARSESLALRGKAAGFVARRARRLLPAYWTALLIEPTYLLSANLVTAILNEGVDWGPLVDMVVSADMLSHLFLLHNLSSEWTWSINPTLWTMATLWWSYLAFALILWPLWRWFGVCSALGASVVLGLLPAALGALGWPTLHGHPHLIAAFGLGMAGAALLYRRPDLLASRARKLLGWAALSAVLLFAGVKALEQLAMPDHSVLRFAKNMLLSAALTGYMVLNADAAQRDRWSCGPAKTVHRMLESRPLAFLGRISYSLYLTHYALWQVMQDAVGSRAVQRWAGVLLDPLLARALVAVPVTVLGAWGFYAAFERPFARRRR